jgi:hypothetical protein
MLKWVMTEMMRIEAKAKVGAAKGKLARERTTYFSGARARRVDTRMGTVYLLVTKVRKGGYVPFFISERRRSEHALIAVVQEAFINGVSTRKIERLGRAMGIENISADQVSEFNKELDTQIAHVRTRPLVEEYPFLWIDALYCTRRKSDVPHEVDLAALPGGAQPLPPDRGLDPRVGVGDAKGCPFHASGLELPEEGPPGVFRLVEHGLESQELPRSGRVGFQVPVLRHRGLPLVLRLPRGR